MIHPVFTFHSFQLSFHLMHMLNPTLFEPTSATHALSSKCSGLWRIVSQLHRLTSCFRFVATNIIRASTASWWSFYVSIIRSFSILQINYFKTQAICGSAQYPLPQWLVSHPASRRDQKPSEVPSNPHEDNHEIHLRPHLSFPSFFLFQLKGVPLSAAICSYALPACLFRNRFIKSCPALALGISFCLC